MNIPVFVKDYGVLLPSGDSAQALLCATLAGVSAVNVIKDIAVAVGSDYRAHFPRLASLPEALEWDDALAQTLQVLLAQHHPVLVVGPESGMPQHGWIHEALSVPDPHGLMESVSEATLPEVLGERIERLRAGAISGLSVLGVDRFTDPVTILQLAAQAKLQTDKFTDGRAVGEGLAWFSLTAEQGPVKWCSSASGKESNAGATVPVAMTGLADIILALEPESTPPRPRLVIHARAQAPQDDLEWHHASQRLWQSRLPPRDNLAMRKGERAAPQPASQPWQQHLKPASIVGELGAAALPMAIVLACERLRWSLSPVREALVVDAGEQPHRCAVWLKKTESQGCDSNE